MLGDDNASLRSVSISKNILGIFHSIHSIATLVLQMRHNLMAVLLEEKRMLEKKEKEKEKEKEKGKRKGKSDLQNMIHHHYRNCHHHHCQLEKKQILGLFVWPNQYFVWEWMTWQREKERRKFLLHNPS